MRIFKGQNGASGSDAYVVAASEPSYPVVITSGVNDQFVYTPISTGIPDTFTIPPGTYGHESTFFAALSSAVDSMSNPITDYLFVAISAGFVQFSSMTVGTGDNGDTITEGNGGAAAMGFTSLPAIFVGGVDSTEGFAACGVFLIEEVDVTNDANGLVFKGTLNDRMEWLSRQSFSYPWSGGCTVASPRLAI